MKIKSKETLEIKLEKFFLPALAKANETDKEKNEKTPKQLKIPLY